MIRPFMLGKKKTSSPAEFSFSLMEPAGGVYTPYHTDVGNEGNAVIITIDVGRVYVTTDAGLNWDLRDPSGADAQFISAVSPDGTKMAVGENTEGRLYYSSDSGVNWSEIQPDGDADKTYREIVISDSEVIHVRYGNFPMAGVITTSPDGGANWNPITITKPAIMSGVSIDGQYLLVVNEPGAAYAWRIYKSSNGGSTWEEIQPEGDVGKFWTAVAADDTNTKILAGVGDGGRLYLSSNGGTDWSEIRPGGADADLSWAYASMSADGQVMAVSNDTDMYVSYDGGESWVEVHPTGTDIDVYCLFLKVTKDGLATVVREANTNKVCVGRR